MAPSHKHQFERYGDGDLGSAFESALRPRDTVGPPLSGTRLWEGGVPSSRPAGASSLPAPSERLVSENRLLRRELARQRFKRRHGVVDYLTGLYDARYLQRRLEQELARAECFGAPLSYVVIELADMEELAHDDARERDVLCWLASVVTRACRPFDVPCRSGDREIAVILPETGPTAARAFIDAIQQAVCEGSTAPALTGAAVALSFGTAVAPRDAQSLLELMMAAEESKIMAKRAAPTARPRRVA